MNFSQFDNQVNLAELKKNVEEAKKNGGTGDFPDIPEGEYMASVDKLEIGTTKDGRPMLKAQFNILDGEFKKHKLFMNRVLYGTKNDAAMISSAVGFLESLGPTEDVGPVAFESYSQFDQLVLDVAEDIEGLEYKVKYRPDAFNSIHVEEIFEAE